MYFNKTQCSVASLVFLSAFTMTSSFAGSMGEVNRFFKGHFLVELGGYSAVQGKAQHISLQQNLVGNAYTVTTRNQGSGVVGLGYLLDGPDIKGFPFSYGINAFFLGQTSVSGYIVEEEDATNLAYRYRLQSIPVFFEAKTIVKTKSDKFKLAFDAGIGPNFMSASRYREMTLTPYTLPDTAFSDRNNVNFAVTAGASVRVHDAPGQLPIECGYRFFYLGQGSFTINNSQALNAIKTGDNYANALICTVTI